MSRSRISSRARTQSASICSARVAAAMRASRPSPCSGVARMQQKPAARQVISGWQVALAFEILKAQCFEIVTLVEESGDLEAATFGEVSG